MGDEGGLVGDRAIDDDRLLAIAAEQSRVVAEEHDDEHESHERQCERVELCAHSGEETERESCEVVCDLVLRDLRGTQADDGQHAEQAEADSCADGGRTEHLRDGENADVDDKEGDDEVAPAVAGEIHPEGQDADRHKVDRDKDELGHGVLLHWSMNAM